MSPRKLKSSVDPALEAICLKAMANTPADRYGSPRALADDVEHWLADEPVSAWAEPWTRKATRWLARHRTGVATAAAALLVGLVGLTGVAAVQAAANKRLRNANSQLAASFARERKVANDLRDANDEIKARFGVATDAIKHFHDEVSQDLLLKEPAFGKLRTRLFAARPISIGGLRVSSKHTPMLRRKNCWRGPTRNWQS